jgi:hypothetical protein
MDPFTIVLIVLGAALVVTVVILEVRGRRRPGHHISLNAPMESPNVGTAHLMNQTNIHNGGDFGGTSGGL